MAYYAGTATVGVGLWAKISGTWTKVGTSYEYVNGVDGSATSTGRTFSRTITVSAGTGIEAFGITIESIDNGTSETLTAFTSVSWTTTATSGTRSATPAGEKGRITVRPQ